jgi:hypothetical protein
MNEEEYIKQRLDDQQTWYESKSAWNQKCYKQLRMVEVVLAAGIPFVSSLIGRFPNSPNAFPIIVSVIAFLIAAISALLALYRFQDNWMQYRSVAEQLKREKFLFLTKSQPYAGEDPFHVLVDNVEKILGEENNTWREQLKSASTTELSQQVRQQVKAIIAEETQK